MKKKKKHTEVSKMLQGTEMRLKKKKKDESNGEKREKRPWN